MKWLLWFTIEQMLPGGAKVSGTTNRFRQFDAAHHSQPLTVRSELSSLSSLAMDPGAKNPVSSHSAAACSSCAPGAGWSAAGIPVPAGSQLMPMTGMATSEQGTVSEQPRSGLSSLVQTSKLALPSPLTLVAA